MIEIENISKTYGTLKVLSDVSLKIPEKTIFGVIGKSGAGKSTLIRIISLLEKTDKGAVFYSGNRVDNLPKKELIQKRRHSGMIFQNFNLFSSRTAAQNIAYPMEIAGFSKQQIASRIEELLSLVGLEGRGDAPISTLSGGQKQRIAIARALAVEPDILFCDEATSALDPQTTRSILSLIRKIQKTMNLTVIMITHQMEVVRDACDFVAVLDDGVVVEQGTVQEIFTNPQSSTTKEFLANLAPQKVFSSQKDSSITNEENSNAKEGKAGNVLSSVTDNVVRWSTDGGRYTLHFPPAMTGEPVLSQMTRQYNVEFNIRAGGVQQICDGPVGTLIVDFSGEEEAVKAAILYLKDKGISVEEEN